MAVTRIPLTILLPGGALPPTVVRLPNGEILTGQNTLTTTEAPHAMTTPIGGHSVVPNMGSTPTAATPATTTPATTTPATTTTPTSTPTTTTPTTTTIPTTTSVGALGGPRAVSGGGDTPFSFGLGLGTRSFNMGHQLTYHVGGATFSFPPVGKSNMSPKAPKITWGNGWSAKGGGAFVHSSGATAKVHHQTRISLANPSQGTVVVTPYGRGVRLPDGSTTGVDRKGRAYVLSSGGDVRYLKAGIHSVGDMPIRVFTATTIDVMRVDGKEVRYDSRGNIRVQGGASALGGGPSAALNGAHTVGVTPTPGTIAPAPTPKAADPATASPGAKGGPASKDQSIDALMSEATTLINRIMTMLQTSGGLGGATDGNPKDTDPLGGIIGSTGTGGGLLGGLMGGGSGLGGLESLLSGISGLGLL